MLRNITLSAEEALIRKARERAQLQHTTLNALFREWMAGFVAKPETPGDYARLMESLDYANAGRKFSREEMHER